MSRIERRKQERLDEVRRFAKESDIPVHNMELLHRRQSYPPLLHSGEGGTDSPL